jgi:ribonuclease BN (tRNA processing enzyme)
VLLAEATLGGGAPDHHQPRTHLSAVEAGLVARRADVRSLVLTHFWHTADRARAMDEAETVFAGEVVVARPHVVVDLATVGVR